MSKKRPNGSIPRRTKGKVSRSIPMWPALRTTLERLPRQSDGWVLHSVRGKKLRENNVLKDLQTKVLKPLGRQFPSFGDDLGMEDGCLHSFRHFFCSESFRGGADAEQIQRWLGHAESKIVQYYRHLRPEDGQRQIKQINFFDLPDGASPPGNNTP